MLAVTSSSIQFKIAIAISLAFFTILAASTAFTYHTEQKQDLNVALDKAKVIGSSYFDGVNTMMLTGNLDQRAVLRAKLMKEPGMIELHIVRAPGKIGAESSSTSQPEDELDARALKGETVSEVGDENGQHTVTYIAPIRASNNYQGTNCLACHQVSEGTIVGAVRATYAMTNLDRERMSRLGLNIALDLLLFMVGLVTIFLALRRIVIVPLLRIRETMKRIEQNADLSLQIPVSGRCEVGMLATSINSVLATFNTSLGQVARTARKVTDAADEIAHVSEQAACAAASERNETDHAASLIHNLRDLADEVGSSARNATVASVDAEREATHGTTATRDAIRNIMNLVIEIESTSDIIRQLDQRSQNVSSVLDVIREIAEQTNLLALNAAIEAARAGDAGRGFAVVADEVRKLATRSEDSTKSIEEIVNQLQGEARCAVETMDRARLRTEENTEQLKTAAASLDRIVTSVTEIRQANTRVDELTGNQQKLATLSNEKVINISEIADRTSQEAARTRTVGEQLVLLAHELNAMVGRFKL